MILLKDVYSTENATSKLLSMKSRLSCLFMFLLLRRRALGRHGSVARTKVVSHGIFDPSTPAPTHTHTHPHPPTFTGKVSVLWWGALRATTHTSEGMCLGFVGDVLHCRAAAHKNARCFRCVKTEVLSLWVGAPSASLPHHGGSCSCLGWLSSHTVHTLQIAPCTGCTILLCSHSEWTSEAESLTSSLYIFMSRFYLMSKIIFQHNASITEPCGGFLPSN